MWIFFFFTQKTSVISFFSKQLCFLVFSALTGLKFSKDNLYIVEWLFDLEEKSLHLYICNMFHFSLFSLIWYKLFELVTLLEDVCAGLCMYVNGNSKTWHLLVKYLPCKITNHNPFMNHGDG